VRVRKNLTHSHSLLFSLSLAGLFTIVYSTQRHVTKWLQLPCGGVGSSQFSSSDLSRQSFHPSHLRLFGRQRSLSHCNLPLGHVAAATNEHHHQGRTKPNRPIPLNSAKIRPNADCLAWKFEIWSVELTLKKMIKIVATRCQILRLKCTKFNFGWGSAPDLAGGAYSAPPHSLAGLRGLLQRGGDGKGRGARKGKGGIGKGRGSLGEGRRRDPTPSRPPNPYFWIRP